MLKLEITVDSPAELGETLRALGALVSVATPEVANDAPKGRAGRKGADASAGTEASTGQGATQANTGSASNAGPTATNAASPSNPPTSGGAGAASTNGTSAPASTQTAVSDTPAASTGAQPTQADFQKVMMATVKAKNAATVQRVLKEATGQTAPSAVKPEQYAAAIAALQAAAA